MISSLLGYQLYSSNLTQTLANLQKTATVSRDAQYYRDNIGKVTTVDQFLGNSRLYTYAMKAYGLEDQTYATALMKKVLQSDLTDKTSYANSLSDPRFKTFAAAFSFATSSTTPVVQGAQQTEAVIGAYSQARVNGGVTAAANQAYFEQAIGTVTSVDQLLNDPKLFSFVANAAGIDPTLYSKSYISGWLTGATTDNPATTADDSLAKLSTYFNFQSDGSLPTTTPATTALKADKESQLVYDYFANTGNASSAPAAANEQAYYESKIGSVATTADLVNDPRLFKYVMTAYGFDPSVETPSYVATILSSDTTDAGSVYSQLPSSTSADADRKTKFLNLIKAFNFGTNGIVDSSDNLAQSTTQETATTSGYFANYQTLPNKNDASSTSTFKTLLADINTVTDLLADKPVWGHDALNYVLKAFGIPPVNSNLALNKGLPTGERTSLITLRKVLTSDPSDPNSFVSKLNDPRFSKLAAAFNFGADGKVAQQRQVQTTAQQTATGTLYQATYGTTPTTAQKDLMKTATTAYLNAVGGMSSINDLLSNQTVLDYALKAYGLDKENLSADKIKKILTSDLGDKTSYANSLNDKRYTKFAQAFNFKTDGTIAVGSGGIQSSGSQLTTENNYLLQTLEEQAGDQNEGSRLALYFLRKAPDVTSSVQLLADKALTQVVQTALGLPASFSNLPIDTQTKYIDSKLKVADLQDPAKLNKFIKRFAGLYDIQNASTTLENSPALQLLGATSNDGILGLF